MVIDRHWGYQDCRPVQLLCRAADNGGIKQVEGDIHPRLAIHNAVVDIPSEETQICADVASSQVDGVACNRPGGGIELESLDPDLNIIRCGISRIEEVGIPGYCEQTISLERRRKDSGNRL